MNNLIFNKYIDLVNEEKKKYGLDLYVPLYPMFRMENNKLYVGVLLVNDDVNVWSKESNFKPEYWVLIDIDTDKIISFNKTDEKDFVVGEVIPKTFDSKQKEISKYTVEKSLQYKEYLKEDFIKFQTPLQKRLTDTLGSEIKIDGENINLNEYIFSKIEKEINDKLNELVKSLVWDKYASIIFYYDILYTQIMQDYKNNNIDNKKIKLCAEIMNNYYDGIAYIDNFFNI